LILIFQRTGKRRYAVGAKRESFPDLEMNPAPGYDPLIPHDLMHLVVEAQLGLTRGIFGQLAAGGNAGTFHSLFDPKVKTQTASRARHKLKKRGKKLLHDGRDDCARSERATFICRHEWLARSKSRLRRSIAEGMSQQAKQVRKVGSAKELSSLNDKKLEEICRHLDELSSAWSKLEVGESITVRWPDLVVSSDPATLK
jgi:hypothetical protein